ncbi:putative glutathione S-transferase [Escherichia coli]|uniref:Putative glutathione S-transferase n=1 Tax=Escherichia coli TaxID=562 RepID=A0A376KIQ1_ECOLX|nr:putative glutathione S-transferase [Escherichia coli]
MKLVGSYTSPFVRKLSILLLEKGITFEFINELPYNADNGVAQFNPLGKVPVLVTEEGECWFDSPIIAEYIELMNVAPAMLPRDPLESLRVRKIEALADGIMDAGLVSVREQARPAAQQSEDELLRQREKINPQSGCAGRISGRWHTQNRYGQSGDYRHCLCRRISQFPPRLRQAGVSIAHT